MSGASTATPYQFRILQVDDVTEDYVKWFSDVDIVRYSDNQYRTFSLVGQKEYVKSCLDNPDMDLYGIFDNGRHIGNITLSGFNSPHNRAEITYVVGAKDYWGKGVAAWAISEIVKLAKQHYKLHRLYAGCAEPNTGSRKVLEKNGFQLEGKRINHLFYNGEWMNQLDFGLNLS
ncbi:GNAT family N-acetyltransferase [Emcibacter sp.]|uniref:GNAT family N-acetyltransferase n=1 Tax=Emcibacter sp. TaxID=1979954 RepID=UPI003A934F5B